MIRLMKSQPVGLLGEAPPRVNVAPKGSKASSWEDVADLSFKLGVELDGWQELILKSALGERSDRTWAAKRVGVTVPRQNGKSQLLVARALAGVLLFEEKKIVISAHQQDTARESFNKMLEIIEDEDNESLRARLKPNGIMNALNREAIKFKNGAVIQFKARSGAGGRGFSSDCLMLDEAQILSQRAWVSINSTMSAMPNPQVWLLGTAPTPEDDGEVFESIRSAALEGRSAASAWVEWGADPQDDPAEEFTRWKANPAWNTRINHEVVQGEFETYPPQRFALDRLGIWLSEMQYSGAIDGQVWSDAGVKVKPEGAPSFGVAFSMDGKRVSLAGCVLRDDDTGHVELIDAGDGRGGLDALADWFCEKDASGSPRWRSASGIVISGAAGAGVLKSMLVKRRVPERRVRVANTPQYLQACVMFADAVAQKTVTHLASEGQAALDASVGVIDKDKRGGWSAHGDGDETPVEAVSLALWGARTSKRKPSGANSGRALVL